MKRVLAVIFALVVSLSCVGCSMLYDLEPDAINGCLSVGYSKILNDAYVGRYEWDGTLQGQNIVVPEEYNGIPITAFGGYSGRGYPSSFAIIFNDEAKEMLCPGATQWGAYSGIHTLENYELNYLDFNIHISKNIETIESLSLGGYIVAECESEEATAYVVYVLRCYVTCDENNEFFYAKDGKLYNKNNDVVVDDIIYMDFDVEQDIIESEGDSVGASVF